MTDADDPTIGPSKPDSDRDSWFPHSQVVPKFDPAKPRPAARPKAEPQADGEDEEEPDPWGNAR